MGARMCPAGTAAFGGIRDELSPDRTPSDAALRMAVREPMTSSGRVRCGFDHLHRTRLPVDLDEGAIRNWLGGVLHAEDRRDPELPGKDGVGTEPLVCPQTGGTLRASATPLDPPGRWAGVSAQRCELVTKGGRGMSAPAPSAQFLLDDAPSASCIERAAAENTTEWLVRCAESGGGEAIRTAEAVWVYSPFDSAICFPRFDALACGDRIDALNRYYLDRNPRGMVGLWSLDPPDPVDLGARLLARGFQPGWQPHWMWLDLERLREPAGAPRGLQIEPVEDVSTWDRFDHPYLTPNENREWRLKARIKHAAAQVTPKRIWHVAAWLDGRPVGAATLNVTTGPLGVAGIYDVGVLPDFRRRGIGAAVSAFACRVAKERGLRHAVLNTTAMGEPVYRRIGFASVGHGCTWWLDVDRLRRRPPTEMQVAMAEAVGRGDLGKLEQLGSQATGDVLNTPLTNEMTLLTLAVHLKQPGAARWLVDHGAQLDVISAWDLGWHQALRELLARQREIVNQPPPGERATPLHLAIWRNEIDLVRLLLEHGADATIEDPEFHSTPLGWARHFGRAEIIELLEGG